MAQKPRFTVSGFRGIWGEDLNEQIAFEYAAAFGKLLKKNGAKKIIIGRDARKTGPKIFSAMREALQKEGLETEYAGILPTPTLLFLVKKLSLDGGIMITASHNPKEYNGFKFVWGDGFFIGEEKIRELEETKREVGIKYFGEENQTKVEADNKKYREKHIGEILKNVDVDSIRKKKFKVALDPINSAGSIIAQELLKELGCEIHVINAEQNGEFSHEPEPLVKNLTEIGEAVKVSGANIGFALDPDADRLVTVNELGEVLSEEYTLAFCVLDVLKVKARKTDIAVNMSTSRLSEDIAEKYGQRVVRTKVGELNVTKKMLELNLALSGEGNGGVIFPEVNATRDSLVGIAFVLELLAKEDKTVSEIANSLPKYFMRKEKIALNQDLSVLYQRMKETFGDAKEVNELDGIRFDFIDKSWIHVRPSNTEPAVRIIGEAESEERFNELLKKVESEVL